MLTKDAYTDKKYSKNSNIVNCNFNTTVIIDLFMQSWIFSIITPVFNVTWSFRNVSLKKHFLLLSMIFLWKVIVFSGFSESSKEKYLL